MNELLGKALGCFQRTVPSKLTEYLDEHDWSWSNCRSGDGRSIEGDAKDSSQPPQPSDEIIQKDFLDLVEDLDLNAENREQLLSLSYEKKWMILCEQSYKERRMKFSKSPEFFTEELRQVKGLLDHSVETERLLISLDELKVALKAESHSYVQRFLEKKGLEEILILLRDCVDAWCGKETICAPLLQCVKALLNSTHGRTAVLESPTALDTVARSLKIDCAKSKIAGLEILSGVCLLPPDGHKKVLQALTRASLLLGERTRFQKLLFDLWRPFPQWKDEIQLKTASMSLINALLKSGVTETSLEMRMHLRLELLNLGMEEVLEQLRNTEGSQVLDDHIDLFEMMKQEDEQEFLSQYDFPSSGMDMRDPDSLTKALRQRYSKSEVYPHLISLYQRLLLIPSDQKSLWKFFDILAGNAMLHANLGQAAEGIETAQLDIQTILAQEGVFRLKKDNSDYDKLRVIHEKVQEELGRAKKELELTRKKLVTIESQFELLKQSRPVTIDTYASEGTLIGGKKTLSTNSASKSLNLPLTPPESPPNTLSPSSNSSPSPRSNLVLPSDPSEVPPDPHGKKRLPQSQKTSSTQPHSSSSGAKATGSSSNNVPPAPPPPPPGLLSSKKPGIGMRQRSQDLPKKSVPKPSVNLKTVNWPKLGSKQVEGTVWQELNDEELYDSIDLEEIETKFATGVTRGDSMEGDDSESMMGTLRKMTRESGVSVIEPRRAQNCNILLSKLRLSHNEIRQAMLSMDEHGIIPKDMAEQLLKYVPTKQEVVLLGESVDAGGVSSLATADRFLWEMSQIPRYEQRLKCLHYRKVFRDHVEDLRPQVQAVTNAAASVKESQRLKQLLSVILAVGNFLNYGKRSSDAVGFQLSALNCLQDVKSTVPPGDYTLLHCIVEICEKQFPDLVRLKRDLSPVFEASRIGKHDLEAELKNLKAGLAMIAEELEIQRSIQKKVSGRASSQDDSGTDPDSGGSTIESSSSTGDEDEDDDEELVQLEGDNFIPLMSAFWDLAATIFEELDQTVQVMNQEFETVVKRFGGDSKTASPDEFFGILARFLTTFSDVHRQLWKKREEMERRKRTMNWSILGFGRKNSRVQNSPSVSANDSVIFMDPPKSAPPLGRTRSQHGDFDQLISALQSGELFSEELTRLRSSFRTPKRKDKKESSRRRSPKVLNGLSASEISRDR